METRVDEYIKSQPSPQREMLSELRAVVKRAFPKIEEGFKNGVPWYEDLFYLGSFKDHVNVGFAVLKLNEDELVHFEGNGKYMRHQKFFALDEIDENELAKLLKLVWKRHK